MNLPNRIEQCPIADYIIEVRFSTDVPKGAVFGIIYNSLKEDFKDVKNLPILQVPEQLRGTDPDLIYKPHYRISDGSYTIQIGPNVFTISSPIPYAGWTEFSQKVRECLEIIQQINVIKKVERLGMRVINFFENINIFENIDLVLTINNEQTELINSTIRMQVESNEDTFISSLQLSNSAGKETPQGKISGSVIDIDTFKNYNDEGSFYDDFSKEIQTGHDIEKNLFFSLLKQDFLESLNPIYDEPKN
jgi:uncharacterized protein (TIGR04255 family)